MALIAIDLNRFKEVNDLYGHAAGDIVLKTLGARMHEVLHENETLARLGGDEFVAVQTSSDRDKAEDLAKRLVASCTRTSRSSIWKSPAAAASAPCIRLMPRTRQRSSTTPT